MSIEKISDAARDAASVGALADRPQATERDGYSGMTPAQLKAAFDALPKLNTAKINEIIDLINGESTESLAYLLQTPVEYQGDTMTLYEFLAAVQDGRFGDIAMIGSRTLSAAIDHAAGEVFDTKMAGVTAEATTLTPGSPATASYNNSTKKFTFGIPKGDPGSGGGVGGAYFVTPETKKSEIESAFESGSIIAMVNDDHIMYATSKRRNDANTGDLYVFAACDIYVTIRYLYTCEAVFFDNDTGNIISSVFSLPIEKMGKITIGGTEYAVSRKALAITENGVTTTYYVADIT